MDLIFKIHLFVYTNRNFHYWCHLFHECVQDLCGRKNLPVVDSCSARTLFPFLYSSFMAPLTTNLFFKLYVPFQCPLHYSGNRVYFLILIYFLLYQFGKTLEGRLQICNLQSELFGNYDGFPQRIQSWAAFCFAGVYLNIFTVTLFVSVKYCSKKFETSDVDVIQLFPIMAHKQIQTTGYRYSSHQINQYFQCI